MGQKRMIIGQYGKGTVNGVEAYGIRMEQLGRGMRQLSSVNGAIGDGNVAIEGEGYRAIWDENRATGGGNGVMGVGN